MTLRNLITYWAASFLFALWTGAVFLAGFGTCYWIAITMLAGASR